MKHNVSTAALAALLGALASFALASCTPSVSSATTDDSSASSISGKTTKQFYVTAQDSAPYTWSQITTALLAQGSYCRVWVAAGNSDDHYNNFSEISTSATDNKITTTQAETIAAVFDKVYPLETGVLGYEYGGGVTSSDSTYGGFDKDPRINIVIYDISGDYTSSQTSGILGYFWSKDERDAGAFTSGGTKYYSNGSEMFYIDSYFTDCASGEIESTLIHEFQHMINYNVKYVKQGVSSDTWFDEMLSMISEESFGNAIGLDSSVLPWGMRMPYHAATYDWYSVTDWQSDSSGIYYSYANSYAFGSYLLHNYGGIPLLSALERNAYTDTSSIVAAVNAVGSSLYAFSDITARYGEALVFGKTNAPSSVNTFFKSAAGMTVNGTSISLPTSNDITSVSNAAAGQTLTFGGATSTSSAISSSNSATAAYATPVTKVSFTGSAASVTLSGLAGHSVYLAQVNTGASSVAASSAGGASASVVGGVQTLVATSLGETEITTVRSFSGSGTRGVTFPSGITRIDHPGAQAFNHDPASGGTADSTGRSVSSASAAAASVSGSAVNITIPSSYTGVTVYPLAYTSSLPSYSTRISSAATWQNVTGDITITLTKPSSSNVSLYLLVR